MADGTGSSACPSCGEPFTAPARGTSYRRRRGSVFVQSFPRADMEECVSAAYEAIVEAALRYTFVHLRAWGAMFDVERARRRSRAVAALSPEDTPVLPDLPLVGGTVLVRLQRLRLTRAERALLRALYVHGVAMQEYAAELGVHTSTVCRRHQHIMHRARRALTSARHSHHRR